MNASTITAIIRHTLGFVGGYLVAKGFALDADQINTIAGSLGTLIAVGWSLWAKRADAKP